jgi:hypothetical protein
MSVKYDNKKNKLWNLAQVPGNEKYKEVLLNIG